MAYVTESILRTKFLFPKNWEVRHFCLFILSLIVGSHRLYRRNTYSFVDIKIERRLRSGKNASMKEAIVLDTVADLIPVTLLCNHEVEATKLCHIYHVPFFFICSVVFIISVFFF